MHFEIKEVIGEQMSLRLLQPDSSYKPWHGYVVQAALLGADGGLARYRLVMRLWLHFLTLRRDSFIHQDKDVRAILEDIFKDYPQANFTFQVTETLRQRSFCAQYRERDFEFMTRLLAEKWRPAMKEGDARRIADLLVAGRVDWSFNLVGMKTVEKRPEEWVVIYEATNSRGVKFDGSIVVLVNKLAGTARFQTS